MRTLFIILVFLIFALFRLGAQRIIRTEIQAQASYTSVGTRFPSQYFSPESKGSANPGFSILGYYHLNKRYGLMTGVGISFFKNTFMIDSLKESFNSIDSENMTYIRNVYGSNISEKTSLIFLNIPVKFFYTVPLNQNISLLASLGPEFSFPLWTAVSGEGTFTYTGRYPALDNVVLKDIPPYGFNSEVPVAVTQKLPANHIIISASAAAGINFSLSRNMTFHTSIVFKRSVTAMVPIESRNNYHLSDDIGSYRSLTGLNKGIMNSIVITAGIQKVILF